MDSLNGTSSTKVTNEIAHNKVPEAAFLNLTPEGFRHGITAYIALAMLFGLPGNALVVLVHKRLKTPTATDWLVFYLAVSDICSLAVCGPSFILMITKIWNYFMPSSLCSFHFMILYSFFMASTTLITVIAVIRRSIMIKKKEIMSARISKFFGAFVIFCSIGFGSPSFILRKNTPSGYCYVDTQKAQLQTLVNGLYLVVILISNALTFACYLNIISKIRNVTRVAPTDLENLNDAFVRTRRRTIKTTKSLALVSVVFFFSTAVPITLVSMLNASNYNVGVAVNTFIFVLSSLHFTNKFAYPLIYLWTNIRFRHHVRCMFQRSRSNQVSTIAVN
ncbi:hypothetical protein DPMN_011810 [Dreissena polymorpha]|uniref:G-protein coupled receptors family 1 profile domain-containing protein n=1 Tax=Dreissena polymorpha TaxID=45954 RepID=A0A9D4S293_DREPO|nr:hypothetical protein DPMN_011810 [Dreissena polymorpha]